MIGAHLVVNDTSEKGGGKFGWRLRPKPTRDWNQPDLLNPIEKKMKLIPGISASLWPFFWDGENVMLSKVGKVTSNDRGSKGHIESTVGGKNVYKYA